MGMYTSFKLVAIIDKPYRELIERLLYNNPRKLNECTECTQTEFNLHKYINYLYREGGFFDVNKKYCKDTGVLLCGGSLKAYGHLKECAGDEIDFCIKNGVLPFGEVKEYYRHEDDLCYDCDCNPVDSYNEEKSINNSKKYYLKKYRELLAQIECATQGTDSTPLKEKMKEFLIKDIESILERYTDYNFDLKELKQSLEKL